jgi:Rieske Fe-S protein
MAQCEVCGNEYDKTMEVTRAGETHVFDSFECAISAIAPTCDHCGCKIIGHGIESNGSMFCCAHCAAQSGVRGARDRVET